MLTQELKLLLS